MIAAVYLLITCPTKVTNSFLSEPKVSPATFCKVFPFHIMFDRELKIVQTGSTVARVIPKVTSPNCRITNILDPVRRARNYCLANNPNSLDKIKTAETFSQIFLLHAKNIAFEVAIMDAGNCDSIWMLLYHCQSK